MSIISVTGHRPDKLGGYGVNSLTHQRAITHVFANWLEINKPDYVLVGMALGFDIYAALTCLVWKIPYIACVPFKGQESVWSSSQQKLYNQVLAAAEDIVIVSPGKYTAKKMQVRNEYMVDRASKVVALWDQSPGGTANCIRYARSRDKEIINLYDEYKLKLNNG